MGAICQYQTGMQNSIARQHNNISINKGYPVHNNFVENDSNSMVHQCESASTAEDTKIEKSSILRARRHNIQQVVLSKNRRLPNPRFQDGTIKMNQQLVALVVQAVLPHASPMHT